MAKKELKPAELAAQREAENAAALEALRKRREKEHRKMERSKGSNKRVGKSWKNHIKCAKYTPMVYIKGKISCFYTFSYENSMVYMIGKRLFILYSGKM